MVLSYAWQGTTLLIQVRVQPHASRNEWLGLHGTRFRIRIAAPPFDGQANKQLQIFLAELFGVSKSRVTLLSGETGRDKRLQIEAPQRLPPEIRPPH